MKTDELALAEDSFVISPLKVYHKLDWAVPPELLAKLVAEILGTAPWLSMDANKTFDSPTFPRSILERTSYDRVSETLPCFSVQS